MINHDLNKTDIVRNSNDAGILSPAKALAVLTFALCYFLNRNNIYQSSGLQENINVLVELSILQQNNKEEAVYIIHT